MDLYPSTKDGDSKTKVSNEARHNYERIIGFIDPSNGELWKIIDALKLWLLDYDKMFQKLL